VLPDVPEQFLATPQKLGEYDGFEVYPMPVFVRFPVPDPGRAATWYIDALGFGAMYTGPVVDGIPMLVHLRRRKFQDILLVVGPGERPGTVNLDATGEIDTLADRVSSRAGIDLEPVLQPWGTRELVVDDPWGNQVTLFAAPDQPPASIDDAMEGAARTLTD
jgi:hypothetical protein